MKFRMKLNIGQRLCCLCLYVIATLPVTTSYNVDIESSIVLQPPSQVDIDFGFSLAHIINGTERTLLVGAPKAETLQDVKRPGALYSCELDKPEHKCLQLEVDSRMKEDDKYRSWITKDLKDEQRLGFSVAANDNNIVVCAPRWHIHDSRAKGQEDLPFGMCFIAKKPKYKFEPFSPAYLVEADGSATSYDNVGSCQFGISLGYFEGRNSIVSGSPGCWNWQGDSWEIGLNDTENKNTYKRLKQLQLEDLHLTESDSGKGFTNPADLYLGYSIATLTFGEKPSIISAMPRAAITSELKVEEKNLTFGPVVQIMQADARDTTKLIIIDTIEPSKNITRNQEAIFSYFGYSLTAVDVNGDGLDDVIVGAPFYHNDTSVDQGAIFVYNQNQFSAGGEIGGFGYEMLEDTKALPRTVPESNGRFGTTVAAIGDIDGDDFQDIAVGAPFLEGGGTVFIYMGSKDGLGYSWSQSISASVISSSIKPVNGFGFSIAQNLPSKSNRGIDLAVGAYNSNIVAVFKSKDVIFLKWELIVKPIDLKKESCFNTDTNTKHPCTEVEVCLNYTKLRSVSNLTQETLEFNVTLTADLNNTKRLIFEDYSAQKSFTMKVKGDDHQCRQHNILAIINEIDDLDPFYTGGQISFLEKKTDKAILDPKIELKKEKRLDIKELCDGHICRSDLRLTVKILMPFDMDNEKTVKLLFTVENHGEPAYFTHLKVLTGGYLLVQPSENIECEMEVEDVDCILGSDFTLNNKTSFTLLMTATTKLSAAIRTHANKIGVNASLTTTSTIIDLETAKLSFEIPITAKGSLDLTRNSNAPNVAYNSSNYFKSPREATAEKELGPEVDHAYKIYNKNKYSIYQTLISIRWPLKVEGESYLLYLMEKPKIDGHEVNCTVTNGGKIDEYNLTGVQELNANTSHGDGEAQKLRKVGLTETNIDYMLLNCYVGEIISNAEIVLTLKSRLVQNTLKILEKGNSLSEVISHVRTQALRLPYGAEQPQPSPELSITTVITYGADTPEFVVPWWVYLVSALGGALILAVIALILWKVGFFNRYRGEQKKEDVLLTDQGAAAEEGEGEDEEDGEENEEETKDGPITPQEVLLNSTKNANNEFV